MHRLRSCRLLTRLFAAWFLATVGLATAAPLVHPPSYELVCTSGGSLRLVVVSDTGGAHEAGTHTLDCALCMPLHAAGPSHKATFDALPQADHGGLHEIALRAATRAGAALPARGPPRA